MVEYSGYDDLIRKVYERKQDHVFEYWNELDEASRKSLLEELASVDFDSFGELMALAGQGVAEEKGYGPSDFIARSSDEDFAKARAVGIEHISAGKVAAFIVAGGQGSRLGYEGPKGCFQVSAIKNRSLFYIHATKVKKYSEKYNVRIPLLIMTSQMNHEATEAHFKENNYFGLDPEDVILFPQNMIPSLDTNGKLIMSGKSALFRNPDGHGGSLTALKTSGAIATLQKRGITTISYFQVDNPLVNIVDPAFIGFHVMNQAEVSSKALIKAYPEEKIGVFVSYDDGSMGVVEYSDLPQDKMFEKNEDGSLKYAAGSIAIHLFEVSFVDRITSGGDLSLPFHVARKKIGAIVKGEKSEIEGFKFEKFVFDALPLAKNPLILETIREEEFAPVKNMSGVDSLDSSRELMTDLFRTWLAARGIEVPAVVKTIEISPLIAVEADDLHPSLRVPAEEKVYIGE